MAIDKYWDYNTIQQWCKQLVEANPAWMSMEVIGKTREGRDILLLTLGYNSKTTPALWLDAGTHAAEWTGMMSVVYCLEQWSQQILTPEGKEWFQQNTIYVVPCMSPDGFQALMDGQPFLRSSTREAKNGVVRSGFEPKDMNGDGKVLWMRWKHPAGPFVIDEEYGLGVRKRRIDDDPAQACFVSYEGEFIEWDGVRWIQAPLKHGLDLNRNFPINWKPFEMFGMDGGGFALSEPESRAVLDAVYARPNIVAAISLHTYTGAILTQPYQPEPILSEFDIDAMEHLAKQIVHTTGYKVYKVHPDFTYDVKEPIIGVWADCLSCTLGIPAYTLELWDPFSWAGIQVKNPASFFKQPSEHVVDALLRKATQDGGLFLWNNFQHPQLGAVEIGGFDYFRTVRNPPEHLLEAECKKAHMVLQNLSKAMPKVKVTWSIEHIAINTYKIVVLFENFGFLGTGGLDRANALKLVKPLSAQLVLDDNAQCVHGEMTQHGGQLDGWGQWQYTSAKSALYPSLPTQGNRWQVTWIVQGRGQVEIRWDLGRAGAGQTQLTLNADQTTEQLRLW